jgi:hypothetical protein
MVKEMTEENKILEKQQEINNTLPYWLAVNQSVKGSSPFGGATHTLLCCFCYPFSIF